MKAYNYIKIKQINWALNKGLSLQGSEGKRGEKAYTMTLEENLFEPLLPEVEKQFKNGLGGELYSRNPEWPCPMQAVHSSAALVVNIFQYWLKVRDFSKILDALNMKMECFNIEFEKKFQIVRGAPPHLDVVLYCKDKKIIAIESKFSEVYNVAYKKCDIQDAYFREEMFSLWEEIPTVKEVARKIHQGENIDLNYVDIVQLIKHILGLMKYYRKEDFYLVYLWYNVPCKEGCYVEQELDYISQIFNKDGINFKAITYQELIMKLAENCREFHPEYIKYITERYL